MNKESDKNFAVKNTTHGCGFFGSIEDALKQIERCLKVPADLRFFDVGKGCQPCLSEELPDPKSDNIATCPFGVQDGPIDYNVKVIYLPNATKT